MIKSFKGEIYKLFHNKVLISFILLIIIYISLVHIVYLANNENILNIYKYFNEEYLILYITLSIFFSSSIINDEYLYGTIIYFNKNKILFIKIILTVIFILMSFIIILCLSILVSFIISKNILSINVASIILSFLKLLPLLIMLNFITLILSIVFYKSSISLIITYLLYIAINYLNKVFIKYKIKSYLLISLYWDLNNNLINIDLKIAFLYLCIVTIILYLIIYIVFINKKF